MYAGLQNTLRAIIANRELPQSQLSPGRALRSNGKTGVLECTARRSEIKLSEAIREGLPARGRKKPGDPVEPIPANDLRPDMVETKNLPVNLLYPPKVVVRVDGTVAGGNEQKFGAIQQILRKEHGH
jgi:hypothetical protein